MLLSCDIKPFYGYGEGPGYTFTLNSLLQHLLPQSLYPWN